MPELRTFRASDGYSFYFRYFRSAGPPRGRLVFVHGIRSHGGWYTRSSTAFAQAGFEVYFLDRRGAGLNTTRRGDAPSFRRLIDDLSEFVQSLRAEQSWLPIFVAGISWGGKLAVGLPYRKSGLAEGLILLCPGLAPRVQLGLVQRARIAAARVLRPSRLFPIPLNDPELFTASPDWQKYIDGDLQSLRRATARFLFSSFSLDIYLRRAHNHATIPVLLLLAQHDRIIDNSRTRRLIEQVPAGSEVIEYPEAHHTLEFEAEQHPWIADVLKWIDRQLV